MPGSDAWEAGVDPVLVPAMRPEVDARTLRAARSGDVGAFEEIVRHYDERLRALAYRMVGDRGAMDDVLQEAYVKAFRSLAGFSARSSLGTWLYRITYNACVDHLRRHAGEGVVERSDLEPAALDDTEALVLRRVSLQAALAGLPLEQRAAVLLVDAAGLTYAEAGAITHCGTGTVASRLARAREALRAALDESDRTEVAG